MGRPSLLPSLAVVVAGLTLGVTGCGDDSGKVTASGSDTLSASALRTKADAICAKVRTETEAVPAPQELKDLVTAAPKVLAISEKGTKEMEALVPSKADAATMTKLITLLKASNTELGKVAGAAKKGDEEAATTALDASSSKLTDFAGVAKKAGFDDCGKAGATTDSTDTTEADTTDTTETTVAEASDSQPFADIDLGDKLKPIDGFTYATLPAGVRQTLLSTFASSPEVTDLVAAVGTTTVNSSDGTSLLIFLGLKRELSADESQKLVDGITAGGSDLQQGDVAGQPGWAYVSADGTQGFVTVRSDTVIIGQSDSVDHLSAVIQGLFTANPDL